MAKGHIFDDGPSAQSHVTLRSSCPALLTQDLASEVAADAATILFNLPDYHGISTTITAGQRQVVVETDGLLV